MVFVAQKMMMMMMMMIIIIIIIIIDKALCYAHVLKSLEKILEGKLTTIWQPQLKTNRNILNHNR
jgi:hypothetical protein